MSHSSAGRCSLSCNETHHRQVPVVVGGEPLSCILLGFTANLSDHDDAFSLWVVDESGQNIDEVGTVERIASNSNHSGLSEVVVRCLIDSLVGQGAGPRHDTNLSLLMNVARHDANLALAWFDDARAVWSDQSRLVLGLHHRLHLDHVHSWDAFSNTNHEVDFSLNCFSDGLGCERWRHVDHRCLGTSLLLAFCNCSEDWQSEVLSASLSLVDSSDHIRPVLNGLLSVEGSLVHELETNQNETYVLTSHALNQHFGVLVDEHEWLSFLGVGERPEGVSHRLEASGSLQCFGEHLSEDLRL